MKLTRKAYASRNEKVLDFVIGLTGWYLLNGVLYVCSFLILTQVSTGSSSLSDALTFLILALPLLVNIVALILLAFTRYWIALGALAAFALALIGTILLGILAYAICFSTGSF